MTQNSFYTYYHTRNDTGEVFYVGKGKGRRAYSLDRNARWVRTATKHGHTVNIAARWETEKEAFEHERFLIACFRDLCHPLTNLTDGGEGASGVICSDETREKMRISATGRLMSPTARARMSLAFTGRKHTSASKALMSIKSSGRVHTDKVKAQIKESCSGQTRNAETLLRMSVANLGKKMPGETRAKISKTMSGRPKSEETRLKMKAAWIVRREKKNAINN